MTAQGNDRVMMEQWQQLAEMESGPIVRMTKADRDEKYGVRAQVTNLDKKGGSDTVSVKNKEGYKEFAERARDESWSMPSGKRGKGSDGSSYAAGDRWQGGKSKKGGKGSKDQKGSSSSSSRWW